MDDLDELITKIQEWADARNLIRGSDPISQFAKLISEAGETANAIIEGNNPEVIDGIGDMFVVIVIISTMVGSDIAAIAASSVNGVYPSPAYRQRECLRLVAYLGKMGDYILKKNIEMFESCVQSALRCMRTMALASNMRLSQCAAAAYNEIKDRKGVMFNGAFIKSTDANYASALAALGMADGTSAGESNG